MRSQNFLIFSKASILLLNLMSLHHLCKHYAALFWINSSIGYFEGGENRLRKIWDLQFLCIKEAAATFYKSFS